MTSINREDKNLEELRNVPDLLKPQMQDSEFSENDDDKIAMNIDEDISRDLKLI
jgi:hypothetical protein